MSQEMREARDVWEKLLLLTPSIQREGNPRKAAAAIKTQQQEHPRASQHDRNSWGTQVWRCSHVLDVPDVGTSPLKGKSADMCLREAEAVVLLITGSNNRAAGQHVEEQSYCKVWGCCCGEWSKVCRELSDDFLHNVLWGFCSFDEDTWQHWGSLIFWSDEMFFKKTAEEKKWMKNKRWKSEERSNFGGTKTKCVREQERPVVFGTAFVSTTG